MWKLGITVAAGIIASLFAGQAQAVPTCTTTVTVTSGQTVPVASLLGSGFCVNASDKTFGNFSDSGFTNTGTASWTFGAVGSNVILGFSGTLGPSTTGTLTYAVAINPAVSTQFLIENIQKDFTLNSDTLGAFATGTLTGTTTPALSPPVNISCVRNVNPSTGSSCPETAVFSPVSSLTLSETLTLGTHAVATALTDSFSQRSSIPEPASLALLGLGLLGIGLARRRR